MKKKQTIIGKITLTQNVKNTNSPITTPSSQMTTSHILHKRAKSSYKLKSGKPKLQSNLNINNVITQVSKNQTTSTINSTFNLIKQSRSLSPKQRYRYLLPQNTSGKKTLVLDLDETLVHSGFVPFDCPSDVVIQIELENEIHDIHVLVRPYVKEFLERMAKKYELVIFTASLSKYANPLLNIIDKQGHVPFRLFREHCTLINTAFVKDLKRLGRDLKDIIILDNSPVAYALNQDNGFPIPSWFNDRNDCELLKIIPILEFLSFVPDVREYIRKMVKDNKVQFHLVTGIITQYNNMLKNNQMPLSLRYGTSGMSSPSSHGLVKSNSNKGNSIKNIFNESKTKWKNKKFLNITGVDFVTKINNKLKTSIQKKKSTKLGTKPSITTSKEETEINRLTSFPNNFEQINQLNTMRNNFSSKKIIYMVTKDKNCNINSLRTKLKNFLHGSYNFKPLHKKNTLSMSQRVNKNSAI